MEGRTAYCQSCHSLAYKIDAHDQVLETSFNNAEQPSHSLRELGAAMKASCGTTKDLPSRLEWAYLRKSSDREQVFTSATAKACAHMHRLHSFGACKIHTTNQSQSSSPNGSIAIMHEMGSVATSLNYQRHRRKFISLMWERVI